MTRSALLTLAVLAGCWPDLRASESAVAFPQSPPDREEWMEALAEGTLALNGPCLRLVTDGAEGDLSDGFLVVWPAHARLDTTGGAVRVTDRETGASAAVGDRLSLGGGFGPETAPAGLATPVPAGCPGPYFVASGIVAAEPPRDADALVVRLARLDDPPVDDLGFSTHPVGADADPAAFEDDGEVYLDASLLADALDVPALADVRGARQRHGRTYLSAADVRRRANALVWRRPGDDLVTVYPAAVLATVIADTEVGRAAQAAGFEVFTDNPY